MKIAISCESTCDLPIELLNQYNIKTIPFKILLGDEEKYDGQFSNEQIFDYVNKTKNLPKTSAINEYGYEEYFSTLLKEYDEVIHFSLSSSLSSTYNNALSASKRINGVHVIDSLTLSTGIALLAISASNLVKDGKTVNEIIDIINKRIPSVQASFVIKRLDYLYKGGRCNALALLGANLFKVCPEIVVEKGKMITGKKFRGNFNYVIKSYCLDILDKYNNPDLSVAFITSPTLDDEYVNICKEYLTNRGFKNIFVTKAGGTVTCHCGEGTIGILFINDGGLI